MDIGQIASALRQLAEEVGKLESSGREGQANPDGDANIKRLAKAYPIRSHILSKSDEAIQNCYLTALVALFLEQEEGEDRVNQMLLLGRIIASFSGEIDLRSYITRGLQADDRFWDSFFELISGDLAMCFLVDAALLSIDQKGQPSNHFNTIGELAQLFGMGKESARKGMSVAKAILEQDFDIFADLVAADGFGGYSTFLGYFGGTQYTFISSDADTCKKVDGKLLITSWEVSNREEVIDLDGFSADEICFRKCRFINLRGIRGFQHKVRFEHCSFVRNLLSVENMLFRLFVPLFQEAEKGYVYIQGANLEFADTEFESCRASKHLLDIDGGRIDRCSFKNCSGLSLPCTYLFDLKNSTVTDSVFDHCTMETDSPDRYRTHGGLIAVKKSKVKNCKFLNCSSCGNSGYGSYSYFAMQILAAVDAEVVGCGFRKCSCSVNSISNSTITNNILGMKNASEKDNTFKDCTSYHYHYGDREAHHDIGELKEV